MKNPRCMKKVQEEVRNFIGNKGFVDEDDIQGLSYLKAVIKETFRLQLIAPLLIPFGAGTRGCPRIYIGIANLELALANLPYKFVWEMPVGILGNAGWDILKL
ncbi:hypothetical protein PTKIN_Ptkin16aG0036000 [Pterospermum kingtungense]